MESTDDVTSDIDATTTISVSYSHNKQFIQQTLKRMLILLRVNSVQILLNYNDGWRITNSYVTLQD